MIESAVDCANAEVAVSRSRDPASVFIAAEFSRVLSEKPLTTETQRSQSRSL
jgi:hypothetical protein